MAQPAQGLPACSEFGLVSSEVGPASSEVGLVTSVVGQANSEVGQASSDVGPAGSEIGPACYKGIESRYMLGPASYLVVAHVIIVTALVHKFRLGTQTWDSGHIDFGVFFRKEDLSSEGIPKEEN